MQVTILAVGRLRGGPEADLISDYLKRFDQTGRALGLGPARVIEIDERKHRSQQAQTDALLSAVPDGAALIALDERGKTMSSPKFADLIGDMRDQGKRELCLVIGGADGHTDKLRQRADRLLSFGQMVWPHMLVRVMLSEQLYRSASIMAGSPYHRV